MSNETIAKAGDTSKVRFGKVFLLSGALCSYLIGSGFASGQEILQFYSGYGAISLVGVALTELIFLWMAYQLYSLGYKKQFSNPYEVYEFYLGKYAGKVYEWYSVLLFYLFFVVMSAGGGAVLNQYFGVNAYVGTIIIGIASMLSCLLGLHKLINVIGTIGPAVILFTIIIGIGAIMYDPAAVSTVDGIIAGLPAESQPAHAAANFFISAIMYNALCLAIGLPFFVACGAECQNLKEARIAGMVGFTVYSAAILLVVLSHFAFMGEITTVAIPALFIAGKVIPPLAVVFSIIILAEIYTTAAPMLWATARSFGEEGSKISYIVIGVAGIVGTFGGGIFPFGTLVNVLYPAMSWLALGFMVAMLVKQFIMKDKTADVKSE
jgi:uncharacterized membrane protein YkvI